LNISSIKSVDLNFYKKTNFISCCLTKNLKSHLDKVNMTALFILAATFAFTYFRKQRPQLMTYNHLLTSLPTETAAFFNGFNAPIKKNNLPSPWHQTMTPATKMEVIKQQDPERFLESHTCAVKELYTHLFQGNLLYQCYSKIFKEKNSKMMGRVNLIPGNFGLWMPGVALVVAYLKNKYGYKEFYVCETLEGFAKKLEKFTNDSELKRGVFIVPCFGSDYWSAEGVEGFKPNFPQHKVAVVVERHQSGSIKLALLDSGPTESNAEVCPSRVEKFNIWDNWRSNNLDFNCQELVFRAILKANLPQNTQLFYSVVEREKHYGCESFAIKDGATFLRDPLFFDKITIEKNQGQLGGFKLNKITTLPPAFMVGTQSIRKLTTYYEQNRKESGLVKEKDGRTKTLSDYIEKHHVMVKIKEKDSSTLQKQNHYITLKTCRYNEIVLQMLTKMTQSEINQCLSETLV
jgi:hypothetical protein